MAKGDEPTMGVLIFLSGFFLMFTMSSLYHYTKDPKARWYMKRADHISIYFMIAGSYTPFILIFYKTQSGLMLLSIMWILTLFGTIFKMFTAGKFKYLSTAIYVLMGIAILLVSDSFFPLLPPIVGRLIILGGVFYLVGVIFYLRKSWHYHHPVWHIFVLAGAIAHWWAVWFSL